MQFSAVGWHPDSLDDAGVTARAEGELNSALFNDRGVPVEFDYGEWASDGGVHYSLRNFEPSR